MGLDHQNGETIEGMDCIYRVVPSSKYAGMPRLTTIVEEEYGTRFRRKRQVERPIFDHAMKVASIAFRNAGITEGDDIDILVQEYPRINVVAFIFCARGLDGDDLLVSLPVLLGEEQIADLTSRGLWQPFRLN